MKKLLFIFVLFCGSVVAQTPIDFKKWQIDDTTYSKQIGGSVRNYQKPDKAWAQIVNDFVIEGDSVLKVDESVLKVRVNKNGVSKVTLDWQDNEYTVTQKLLGIGWIKISTRQSLWIDSTMNWSNISMDSNIVKWTNISPAVDYRVLKDNGRVAHGIFYKPAFLDSAVILYNQRVDSLDIALANVMIYTLSANIDNADSAIGDVPKRRLKDFGHYTFNLRNQQLRFPGYDTLPRIPVRQYWERRGTKIICIEYVMMSKIKKVHEAYPMATIWHNDTKTIDGTTNVEDAYIWSGSNANKNYGVGVDLHLAGGLIIKSLIRVKNVASEIGVGATVTAAVCSLYCHNTNGTETVSAYRVFKPWEEGTQSSATCVNPGVTWNDWDCTTKEWATAGCGNADDGGSDNSGDGTGADRRATAEDAEVVDTDDYWFAWNISSALAQAWYNETINEEGIILISGGTSINSFRSTEYVSGNNPFWVFTYTTGLYDITVTTSFGNITSSTLDLYYLINGVDSASADSTVIYGGETETDTLTRLGVSTQLPKDTSAISGITSGHYYGKHATWWTIGEDDEYADSSASVHVVLQAGETTPVPVIFKGGIYKGGIYK